MTALRDQLLDAVSDVSTDLHELTVSARRRGVAQRRVRRTLATVGSVAATVIIGTAGWTVVTHDSDSAQPIKGVDAPVASQPPIGDAMVPITGRTGARLLMDIVGERVPAAVIADSIAGQGGVDLVDKTGKVLVPAAHSEVYSTFEIRNNTGMSALGVNVQHWARMSELGTTCELTSGTDCHVEQLPGGDVLRTYSDEVSKPDTTRLVAELISPARDLRVVIGSSAANGTVQALGLEDLRAVATDARWGFEVSQDVALRADALTSYEPLPDGLAAHAPSER